MKVTFIFALSVDALWELLDDEKLDELETLEEELEEEVEELIAELETASVGEGVVVISKELLDDEKLDELETLEEELEEEVEVCALFSNTTRGSVSGKATRGSVSISCA